MVNRFLAFGVVGVMLLVVAAQAVKLRQYSAKPVNEITLQQSRLIPFLAEIRAGNPLTYDSTLLNLARIGDGQPQVQDYKLEERVVAEKLIGRLGVD
ncbi:MAG TPA: hypothetical protein VN667_06565 [Burkholderiales bacterium]|nr:hypothetical protein [Burkholderiales bacterium]